MAWLVRMPWRGFVRDDKNKLCEPERICIRRNVILVVEDNDDDRELALLAFRQVGMPAGVIAVSGGAQALELLLPAGQADVMDLAKLISAYWERSNHTPQAYHG